MPEFFKFNLGDEVKDILTNYKGVITARTQWIHGCNTYGVKSKKLKDDKPMDAVWFDEPQLALLKALAMKSKRDTGGPERPVPQLNRQ